MTGDGGFYWVVGWGGGGDFIFFSKQKKGNRKPEM